MKPVKRLFTKGVRSLSIFIATLVICLFVYYVNQRVIHESPNENIREDTIQFAIEKRRDHDTGDRMINITYTGRRESYDISRVDSESNTRLREALVEIEALCSIKKAAGAINVNKHVICIQDKNKLNEKSYALKDVSIETVKKIGIVETLRKYVYWDENDIKMTENDFIGEMALYLKQNVSLMWYRVSDNIFIAGTENQMQVYRGSLNRIFLGFDEKEVEKAFGRGRKIVGRIKDNEIRMRFGQVELLLFLPVEFNAITKTAKGYLDATRREMLAKNKTSLMHDSKQTDELKQHLDNFKKSPFLESIKRTLFRKKYEALMTSSLFNRRTKASRTSIQIPYKMPNKEVSSLDCIE